MRNYNDNQYFSFLVSSQGIDTIPVISKAPDHSLPNLVSETHYALRGQIRVSYNKKYLINAHSGFTIDYKWIEVNKFDSETRQIELLYFFRFENSAMAGDYFHPYGIEYSPDSKYLYMSCNTGLVEDSITSTGIVFANGIYPKRR